MSFCSFSQIQNSEPKKYEISKPALILLQKEAKELKVLKIAYEVQKTDLIELADTNLLQLQEITNLEAKIDFWQTQINKQTNQINKLQRKKSNGFTWLSAGALGGLILGVVISN